MWLAKYFYNTLIQGKLLTIDPNADPDGDELTNAQEAAIGTDPHLADTDGDGAPDGVEFRAHSDPKSPLSVPPADPLVVYEGKLLKGEQRFNQPIGDYGYSSSYQYRQFPSNNDTYTFFPAALAPAAVHSAILENLSYKAFSSQSRQSSPQGLGWGGTALGENGIPVYGPNLSICAISHDIVNPYGSSTAPVRVITNTGLKLRLENKWKVPQEVSFSSSKSISRHRCQ